MKENSLDYLEEEFSRIEYIDLEPLVSIDGSNLESFYDGELDLMTDDVSEIRSYQLNIGEHQMLLSAEVSKDETLIGFSVDPGEKHMEEFSEFIEEAASYLDVKMEEGRPGEYFLRRNVNLA